MSETHVLTIRDVRPSSSTSIRRGRSPQSRGAGGGAAHGRGRGLGRGRLRSATSRARDAQGSTYDRPGDVPLPNGLTPQAQAHQHGPPGRTRRRPPSHDGPAGAHRPGLHAQGVRSRHATDPRQPASYVSSSGSTPAATFRAQSRAQTPQTSTQPHRQSRLDKQQRPRSSRGRERRAGVAQPGKSACLVNRGSGVRVPSPAWRCRPVSIGDHRVPASGYARQARTWVPPLGTKPPPLRPVGLQPSHLDACRQRAAPAVPNGRAQAPPIRGELRSEARSTSWAARPPALLASRPAMSMTSGRSQILRIPRSTVEDLARRGEIRSQKIGRHRRYLRRHRAATGRRCAVQHLLACRPHYAS